MRKGATMCMVTLAVALFFGFIWFFISEQEPEYNGRSLSQWLTICRSSETSQALREEATVALRHIGTAALPILLKRASEQPPQTKQKIREFLDQHSTAFIPKSLHEWARRPPDQTRANEARMGVMILGADAAAAIPELSRLASGPAGRQSTSWAIGALGDIGPPAMPALLRIITNSAAPCRGYTAAQIAKLGINALPALPTLIRCLDDPDLQLAQSCAAVLGELTLSPEQSIPALLQCLHHTDQTPL